MFRRMISATLFAMLMASSTDAGLLAGGNYVILSSTIDNGGGKAAGGAFMLHGTAGQPEASVAAATGGDFVLAGGFWAPVVNISELIFKDGFEDSPPSS